MSYPELSGEKSEIFTLAVDAISKQLSNKQKRRGAGIVDYNGRPITSASYHQIERAGAKRQGSMKNWIPRRIFSDQQQSVERETLVDRAIDLTNNDPRAAGAVDSFATTIIGSGLQPYPNFTPQDIGLSKEEKEEANAIKRQLRRIVRTWAPFADAGERMSFGALQFLAMSQIVGHGECLYLLPMVKDEFRPYSLAMQAINPLRLKTPRELINAKNVRDGVEVGKYGQPVAYWIKRSEKRKGEQADVKKNFVRIPARVGHRINVIHLFYSTTAEQVRGVPWFAPAIKFFRDLNDYLDAELVSNIVTAAFSMFVEVQDVEPDYPSLNMTNISEAGYLADGTAKPTRYQELIPGTISYLNPGEVPHTISQNRPGSTFEPFIRVIEKSIAIALGVPHPVLFKDFSGMNYASYRSAMLEAWRLYMSRRQWFGRGFCQGPYRMLAEEAYLAGVLPVDNFYSKMWEITSTDWIGPPKGQIEPIKEIQADEKAHALRVKSRRKIALERGEDFEEVIEQIDEEDEALDDRGLLVVTPSEDAAQKDSEEDEDEEK